MSIVNGGHPDEVPLTEQERKAIASLKRLAKNWPDSLWLFSQNGNLLVIRKDIEGRRHPGSPQEYEVTNITGIDNDGGDW